MKRKAKKITALLLAFVLGLSMLPEASKVSATDYTGSGSVTVGEWDADGKRTTTWKLNTPAPDANVTLNTDDTYHGIKVEAGTAYVKTGSAGLSFQQTKNAKIAIPVASGVGSVDVTFNFSSNNNDRYIDVEGIRINLGDNSLAADTSESPIKIDANKSATVTVSGEALEDGWITVTPYTVGDGDSGEAKIGELIIVETKAATEKQWQLKDATGVQFQGTTGEWNGLLIDATQGKVNIRTGQWAQFNTGAIIKVPVQGPSKVTITSYSAGVYTFEGTASTATEETFTYTGEAGYVTLVATANDYLDIIKVTPITIEIPEAVGNGKIDVWDFGGEALDETKYNNILNADILNKFFTPEGKEVGSTGVSIGATFVDLDENGTHDANDVRYNAANKVNHRLRSSNTALTRYDNKFLIGTDHTYYTGYLYSNSSSTVDAYVEIYAYANDLITFAVSSNGGASNYVFASADGTYQETFNYEVPKDKFPVVDKDGNPVIDEETGEQKQDSANARTVTFAVPADGLYRLYTTNEKLCVGRIYREHTVPVEVSGTVTAPSTLAEGYKVLFTNKTTGAQTEAKVKSGAYTAYLYEQFDYKMTLVDANGYMIEDPINGLSLAKGAGATTQNIKIKALDLVTVTGTATGIPAEELAKAKFTFTPADPSVNIYVPEVVVSGTDFSYKVEANVDYTVTVDGVNDYELKTTTAKFTADATATSIVFEKKPVYDITVNLKDISDEAKATAVITFTNINEEGYVYTFKMGDAIKLRDGQYKVSVTGVDILPVIQDTLHTPQLKVAGAAASVDVAFESVEGKWDFGTIGTKANITTIGDYSYFAGLKISGPASINKGIYLNLNNGSADTTVEVPVKAGDVITVSYCYQAALKLQGAGVELTEAKTNSGSTSQIDKTTVTATEDGILTITGTTLDVEGTAIKVSYITSIIVTNIADMKEYKETITVGADKDYKTIGEAVKAAEEMYRPNNERVTIVIDPGNYEEMLVINGKNITLKNAAAKPSTDLTDKGVGIAEGAVRITSYYGHGYSYYSMGTDCKYDEELLAINKANGALSFANPGTGTTSGSYWNATVVVYADGFIAKDIIFENSFNQYVSKKEANDVLVMESGAKGNRIGLEEGSTAVQDKSFVERAAALAIANGCGTTMFDNCRFVGRQDTLYGGVGNNVVFDKCQIMGACDYIFGGMTAVFNYCDLVANTSNDKNDVFYITAAQQDAGTPGYLMYKCTVTSTTPGVDTASTKVSKPGYFGRPWSTTSEVVFYETTIETTDFNGTEESLIAAAGWLSTLGGESPYCYEYGTIEKSGVDNSANRASWTHVLTEAKIGDEEITFERFVTADVVALAEGEGLLGAPETGDTMNAGLYIVLFGAALAVLFVTLKKRNIAR
ncbi:MAG: hypothetical protein IKL73_06810 [Lachnospiraceae bacterium]|nr:hypothetical protein [Lachnospiraceae bacterium]